MKDTLKIDSFAIVDLITGLLKAIRETEPGHMYRITNEIAIHYLPYLEAEYPINIVREDGAFYCAVDRDSFIHNLDSSWDRLEKHETLLHRLITFGAQYITKSSNLNRIADGLVKLGVITSEPIQDGRHTLRKLCYVKPGQYFQNQKQESPTGLSAIIENLKQLPEDGFRVWGAGYSGLAWLPYLTVFYPVQIGKVGENDFSVKPVGDVADILWNRYPDREAAMMRLIEGSGLVEVSSNDPFQKTFKALEQCGLVLTSPQYASLISPDEFLDLTPDFNRPATEPPKGAGNAPLDRSKVKAITQINAFHFANKDYARMIAEGQVRVYISELQEITNAYEQAPNPGYYTLKLWNFRTNSPETMELWQHSGRVLTCYWLIEPPEGEGMIKTAKRPEKEFPNATNWKTNTDPAPSVGMCEHGDGAIMWNPYNRVYQCHKCGLIFTPASVSGQVESAPLPPARPVALTSQDLALAVRNLCSNLSGGVNEIKLFHFIREVMGDQKPSASPDPQPLQSALIAIASGMVGDLTPEEIAAQALYAYDNGQRLTVATNRHE